MRAEWVVDVEGAGQRLDKFLAAPGRIASRGRAARALDRGQVFLNDEELGAAGASRVLVAGDRVKLWLDRPGSAKRRTRPRRVEGCSLVFEDASLVVVDKPAGLLTVPLPPPADEASVLDVLDKEYAAATRLSPLVVHRIDRDTSGLVVFAKTRAAMLDLKRQFLRREPERVYLAVVHGVPERPEGRWHDWVTWNARGLRLQAASRGAGGAIEAECRYRVVEALNEAALIEVSLVTGRQNQIRAQADLHGHPLVGERKYAEVGRSAVAFARQALHAHRLAFAHPVSGQRLRFESPVPADLEDLLARLRRRGGTRHTHHATPSKQPGRRASRS
jgi:23S rRNA pseudouridine1911/1915/1917 synthase